MRNVTFNLITRQIVGCKLLLDGCQGLNEIPFMDAITGWNKTAVCSPWLMIDGVSTNLNGLRLMKENHDSCSAGHPGRSIARTYSQLARRHYWPGMTSDVRKFVRSCDACQRMKSGRQNKGLSQPLEVPQHPWQHISMILEWD